MNMRLYRHLFFIWLASASLMNCDQSADEKNTRGAGSAGLEKDGASNPFPDPNLQIKTTVTPKPGDGSDNGTPAPTPSGNDGNPSGNADYTTYPPVLDWSFLSNNLMNAVAAATKTKLQGMDLNQSKKAFKYFYTNYTKAQWAANTPEPAWNAPSNSAKASTIRRFTNGPCLTLIASPIIDVVSYVLCIGEKLGPGKTLFFEDGSWTHTPSAGESITYDSVPSATIEGFADATALRMIIRRKIPASNKVNFTEVVYWFHNDSPLTTKMISQEQFYCEATVVPAELDTLTLAQCSLAARVPASTLGRFKVVYNFEYFDLTPVAFSSDFTLASTYTFMQRPDFIIVPSYTNSYMVMNRLFYKTSQATFDFKVEFKKLNLANPYMFDAAEATASRINWNNPSQAYYNGWDVGLANCNPAAAVTVGDHKELTVNCALNGMTPQSGNNEDGQLPINVTTPIKLWLPNSDY